MRQFAARKLHDFSVRKYGEQRIRITGLNLPKNQVLGLNAWEVRENIFNGHKRSPENKGDAA
jgi:hypothetical protein